MLREETVSCAANIHCAGARFLRDSVASLLPCCTLFDTPRVLMLQRMLDRSESLLNTSVSLSTGLLKSNGLSRYTAVIEARMQLLGISLDSSLLSKQQSAARATIVPPGTRSDVYNGFLQLSEEAEEVCHTFGEIAETYMGAVRDGRVLCAVPPIAVKFLQRLCADYAAACRNLVAEEPARLVCRPDAFSSMLACLQAAAVMQGVDAANASADALAAMASSGILVSLPPVLFDILLRYESLDKA